MMGQSAVEVFKLRGAMPNGGRVGRKEKVMTHQTSQNPPLPPPSWFTGNGMLLFCFFFPPVSDVHLLDKLRGQGLG